MEPKQSGNGPLLGVVGLFFGWRAYDALHISLRYGHVPISGVLFAIVAVICLVFAYGLITARKPIAAAPEPTIDPPLEGEDAEEVDPHDLTIQHPALHLTMPDGWTRKPAPDPLFAMFEDERHIPIASLNVVLAVAPVERTPDDILATMMAAHAKSLAANHARRMDPQPFEIVTKDGIREAVRQYYLQGEGPPWRVTARYATTIEACSLRGFQYGHPVVQITCYESIWDDDTMKDLVADAAIVPTAKMMVADDTGPRYPYVLHKNTGKQRDEILAHHGRAPEGMAGLVELGNDLYLTVAEDHPNGVRPLFPDDLDGTSLDAALDEAGRRVARELGTDEIPLHVYEVNVPVVSPIWQPGMHVSMKNLPTMKILVVGPSWKAASAIGSEALYDRAAAEIGSGELCALVPHRDRLFVFADRGAENEHIAARIVAAEQANALKPLSPRLFRLRRDGIRPDARTAVN